VVEDTGPNGRTEQVCAIDEGLYMNLGPGRLPYHHARVMHYCRELAVPLEVYVMTTAANLYQTDRAFDGKPQTRQQIDASADTYIAELLAKAIDRNGLDAELSAVDRAAFRDMLGSFGGISLGTPLPSVETPRAGCLTPMTVEAACIGNPPLPLDQLLKSSFWARRFYQPLEGEWQPTLFQPVGGMDKFVDAFVKHVGRSIRYNAEVQQIDVGDTRVSVSWRDRRSGSLQTTTADYCLSNIPLPKLGKLKTNLAEDYRRAIAQTPMRSLYKIAWQANRRFWEEPPYNIFGGISYTDRPITQIWYPSNDYMSAKGILDAYTYGDQAEAYGRMTLAARIDAARGDAIRLHKEFADKALLPDDKAVSIAWNQAEGQSAGFTPWDDTKPDQRRAYERLLAPDRRFIAIGDQLSPLSGWQEGAFLSAEHAIKLIAGQRPA
jgi:monoamine oxidase